MSTGVINATTTQSTKAPDITKSGATAMQRKCACGNHASSGECTSCAKKKVQRKLSIGASNDPLELEADRVADQVMANHSQHKFGSIAEAKVQRTATIATEISTAGTNEEETAVPASVERVLERAGRPLPASIRSDMEQRFGHDFSQVRIHTGAEAEQSAADVNANAYTVKNNIVFGTGHFVPENEPGKRLLAHELTHVVQQAGANRIAQPGTGNSPALPHVAQSAPANISRSTAPVLQRMTSKEAQKKLWGLVPDVVKPYAKPLALKTRDAVETVIPPSTELPKVVEQAVEKAVSVTQAISPPIPAPAAQAEAKPDAKKAAAPAAKKTPSAWMTSATKEKVRDRVMENLGTVKGVMLEATNIVDSMIWVSHAGNQLAESGIDKVSSYMGASEESRQGALQVYRTVFSQYSAIQEEAKKHGWIDEVTGAVSVSGKFSAAFDSSADSIEKNVFDDVPKEKPVIFTSYELGELKGAVGSQVALAYVGVEEVQLILKGLGVIDAAKGIVMSVQQNPNGWHKDPNFWVAILNAALTVVGLRQTKAAARLSKFLIAAGSLGNAIPIILRLVQHYTDPQLDADPAKKQKLLAQDYSALIRVVADAITALIQHANATKKAGEKPAIALDESSSTSTKPAQVNDLVGEAAPAARAAEPAIPAAKMVAELVPIEPTPTKPAKTTHAETKPTETASAKPASEKITPEKTTPIETVTPEQAKPATPGNPKEGTSPVIDKDSSVTAIVKEQALAEKSLTLANGEHHEAVVTAKGIGLCSPGPCPVIHIEYKKELADFPFLKKWEAKVKDLRAKGQNEAAANEAAQLIRTLDMVRTVTAKKGVPANKSGKGMTVETTVPKTAQEKQAASDFKKITNKDINDLVEKAFSDPGKSGAKIDADGVTDKTINSKSDRSRHLDVEGPKDANGKPQNPGQVLTIEEARLAKKVLGKTIASSEAGTAVKNCWDTASAEVQKKFGPLTKDNYADLYNKTRDIFWDNIRGNTAAKKFFTDGGFSFDEGRAPMLAASSDKNLRPSQSRISLDHLDPKATGENWRFALDSERLMFVIQADNTKLQHIESTKPSLKR